MKRKIRNLSVVAISSFVALAACARTPEPVAAPAPAVSAVASVPEATVVASTASTVAADQKEKSAVAVDPSLPLALVHKNESCGCCVLWVEHLRAAGFAVEVRNADDLDPIKTALGVPAGKRSCHTAEIGGYFIEGHVPAEDIKKLLAEKPDAKGLVLPGMPMGSPGMEVPDGRSQPYTVELVGKDGSLQDFAQH